MWSRRQFLGALTASGASCALAPLLGCGAQQSQTGLEATTVLDEEHLLSALSILESKLSDATVYSRIRHSQHVSVDHEEEQYDRYHQHIVVLTGKRDGATDRVTLYSPTREELLLAAASLSEHAIAPILKLKPLVRFDMPQPLSRKLSDYRDPVRSIFARAQEHGSSRIIYRSSYLHAVHAEQRFLSRSQNLRIESQRTRTGLVMAAWAGGEVASSSAQLSDSSGPDSMTLSSETLAKVADDTLAHLHARSAPTGPQEVLLSPQVAALVAYRGAAQTRAPGVAAEDSAIQIVDDPTIGYGKLVFDDEGHPCAPHVLAGAAAAPEPMASRRRYDDQGQLRHAPSHVRVDTGQSSEAALVSRVKTGVLLEGPEYCTLDPRGERMSLVTSRAREILNGRFTGRLFARTLSTARISDFISNTAALGQTPTVLAFDDDGIAGSAEAPHWLSRAQVEGI